VTQPELEELAKALASLSSPYYKNLDFWINVVLATAGLVFSVLAFREARQAKVAAKKAGRSVRLQTVALELTEISNKLDRVEPDVKYRVARDLLSETSRRITRSISAFEDDEKLKDSIATLKDSIDVATTTLNQVRPITPGAEEQAPQAVYNAVEAHFAKINNGVANLVGLMERLSTSIGE
jgi:hypothetical protein